MGGTARSSERRDDREGRNGRIAGSVVEVAVLVAVVWAVATAGMGDRSPTPPAPTVAPAPIPSTEPSPSGPALVSQYPPSSEREDGLPAVGAVPSTPQTGNLVAHFAEPYWGWVYVYADGRVIWNPVGGATWELRLTPYGVDLVRAGAFAPSEFLNPSFSPPANAWADHEIRPYVASSYAICFRGNRGPLQASRVVGLLPGPAETLLSGKERTYDLVAGLAQEHRGPIDPPECSGVSTEEARALAEILGDPVSGGGSGTVYDLLPPGWAVSSVGDQISISFNAILPHGTWAQWEG